MTAYIQTLRNKSIQSAQSKLSKHRELGTKTNLNVFEVAELMDTLKFSNFQEDTKASVFFSLNLN
ncbi:MAG: hypothetical protein FGM14_06870 [Flavobacteriales bacterium]|jgi:hypothetical protein|nr:hypothetical protein [Flavobacteriales bacterium]